MKIILLAILFVSTTLSVRAEDGAALSIAFQREVDMRLDVPEQDQARYAGLLDAALAGIEFSNAQYLLLVDRSPKVQAVLLYFLDLPAGRLHFIGASPVATGKPGQYDYFLTPVGLFAHTPDNMDYRAEGTFNVNGIRGLGLKGMRVFDFGWVQAKRGWDERGLSPMRLLIHATDPDYLEPSLGVARSKGCVRIPATLNIFIDRYGLLDADYQQALERGEKLWVLRPDRIPTAWPGRYLVIVDSNSKKRPAWSPRPSTRKRG